MRCLAFVVLLSGCHLYFDSDQEPSAADAGAAAVGAQIARECIHNVVAGDLLLSARDELFVTWGCNRPGIVTYLVPGADSVEPHNENANYQDAFGALRLANLHSWPLGIVARFEHLSQIWIFAPTSGHRVAFERELLDILLTDLDGDAKRDFVAVGDGAIRMSSAYHDTYQYPLGVKPADETVLLANKPFVTAAALDLGGTTASDLFYATADGELGVAIQTAPGTFAIEATAHDPGDVQPLQIADLDGDQRADVVGAAGHLFVWSSKTSTIAILPAAARAFAVGDVDGDGRAEVLYITPDRASVRRVRLDGAAVTIETILETAGADLLAVGNFDGDARDDLAIVYDASLPTSRLVVHRASKLTP